jgi:hypothetical protein
MKQRSPIDIPEISVSRDQMVSINSAYTDASKDFRLELLNKNTGQTIWFMYDDKKEAQEEGWVV